MKIWHYLLAAFLILYGLINLIGINFSGINIILGIIALMAGIVLLIDR